jgi:aminoglycoside phosphotransferase (APT) family kinase protein
MASLPRTAEVERRLREHPVLRCSDMELVRKHRVTYSELLEYRHQSDPGKPRILVKHRLGIVPPEKTLKNFEKEFRGLEALWNRAGSSLVGTVPKPLAYLPEVLAIVLEKLPGRNLETVMKWEGNRVTGPLRVRTFRKLAQGIGRWLRCFHDATVQPPDIHASSVYLAKVSKWVSSCREAGLDAAVAREVLDRTNTASDRAQGEELPMAASHGDLIPVNVLVDQGRVAVVDFGGYREREPVYEDLAMFLAYLGLMEDSGFYWRRAIQVMAQSFLEGYARPLSSELLNLYILKATLDILACQFRAAKGSFLSSRKLHRLEGYLATESRRLLPDQHNQDPESVLRQ